MRSITPVLVLALLASSLPATAQNACPCIPLTHLWTVTTCTDWNCASAALAVANGDTATFAVPVGMDDQRWLVIRRMTAGSGVLPPADDPFQVETFDTMTTASTRYLVMVPELRPILMTAPDGHVLVLSLRNAEPRRRTVAK